MSEDKIFYPIGQIFSEIFILGQFLVGQKISVTEHTSLMCIKPFKRDLSWAIDN